MAELVVVGYPDVDTANEALENLRQLDKDMSLKLRDAAVVVKSSHGEDNVLTPTFSTSQGAVAGSFLGAVVGVLFAAPAAGAVVGGVVGGAVGTAKGREVEGDIGSQVADVLEPDTAALVAYVWDVIPNEVMAALAPLGGKVLRTSLDATTEARIQRAIDAQQAGGV
jgi:uncharacterized membrane protein